MIELRDWICKLDYIEWEILGAHPYNKCPEWGQQMEKKIQQIRKRASKGRNYDHIDDRLWLWGHKDPVCRTSEGWKHMLLVIYIYYMYITDRDMEKLRNVAGSISLSTLQKMTQRSRQNSEVTVGFGAGLHWKWESRSALYVEDQECTKERMDTGPSGFEICSRSYRDQSQKEVVVSLEVIVLQAWERYMFFHGVKTLMQQTEMNMEYCRQDMLETRICPFPVLNNKVFD